VGQGPVRWRWASAHWRVCSTLSPVVCRRGRVAPNLKQNPQRFAGVGGVLDNEDPAGRLDRANARDHQRLPWHDPPPLAYPVLGPHLFYLAQRECRQSGDRPMAPRPPPSGPPPVGRGWRASSQFPRSRRGASSATSGARKTTSPAPAARRGRGKARVPERAGLPASTPVKTKGLDAFFKDAKSEWRNPGSIPRLFVVGAGGRISVWDTEPWLEGMAPCLSLGPPIQSATETSFGRMATFLT
jgi:hypothetical protein